MSFSQFLGRVTPQSDARNYYLKIVCDISVYLIVGFILGTSLEYLFPKVPLLENNKDITSRQVFFLILQIYINILIIIAVFVYMSTRGGSRYGLIAYMLALFGTQQKLLEKIHLFSLLLTGSHGQFQTRDSVSVSNRDSKTPTKEENSEDAESIVDDSEQLENYDEYAHQNTLKYPQNSQSYNVQDMHQAVEPLSLYTSIDNLPLV